MGKFSKCNDEEMDQEAMLNLVKRRIPICMAGTFICNVDIIESCKDLLVVEKPELLHLDLSQVDFDLSDLALECMNLLINKNSFEQILKCYDGKSLDVVHTHDVVFVGANIIQMDNKENRLDFMTRIANMLYSLGIKLNITKQLFADQEIPTLNNIDENSEESE
ncbi:MAG: hypothetical protein AABY22_07190, partial [Nanoarchaeota archaeon]